MTKNNFKFKIITEPSKDSKILEKAISVDYKGKRNNYVDILPILKSKNIVSPQSAGSFVRNFKELCNETTSNVCECISLGTLCDLKKNGILLTNTNKESTDKIQRNIVKDMGWISNLVVDILIGYQAIPSITLASEMADGELTFYATDGQQRLFAIISLLNNEFPFIHTGTCIDGLYFKDLPLEVKEILEQRVLVAQISKPEFSNFRKYSFIKLNTSATTLNSIEMANAMYSSDFSSILKDIVRNSQYKYIAAMVTTTKHDLVKNPAEIPIPLKDRQTEYDRLLFAYANSKVGIDEIASAKRAKRALQVYYLSKWQNKKINADAIISDINRVSRLMYVLFGPLSTHEYITYSDEDGVRKFDTTVNGKYLHKSSISNMQYNSLYFIADYLYKNGIRSKHITSKIQDKVTKILDKWFTSPDYICMKGWNNNNSVYKANLNKANEILSLFEGN